MPSILDHPETTTVKLRSGRFMKSVTLIPMDNRIYFKFAYDKKLMEEIKESFTGAKWHGYDEPKVKMWSVVNDRRAKFNLEYLAGGNPYEHYRQTPNPNKICSSRDLYKVQYEMANFICDKNYCIIAGEMGIGKTLAVITAMEVLGLRDEEVWYVGPVAGVRQVYRELRKWKSKVNPCKMLTYNGLVKTMSEWLEGPAPKMVIYDESSLVKNATAKRSQAALALANAVYNEHGYSGYVVCMSGTPAPRTPADWWHQCEIVCPGFLREGSQQKLKARLCLIEQRESMSGGVYPHIVTWLDNKNKCAKCGELADHENHEQDGLIGYTEDHHAWRESINEVHKLHKRMVGIVLVRFKKDCLDLPEKRYETIFIKPTVELIRAANLIRKTSPRAIQALCRLRELSDGFQYTNEKVGEETCSVCSGKGRGIWPQPKAGIDPTAEGYIFNKEDWEDEECECDGCGGTGKINVYKRAVDAVGSPKDQYLIDDMEQSAEHGRLIVWGGFQGTVDRLILLAQQKGWAVLRVDGRGYKGINYDGTALDADLMLDCMDGSDPKRAKLLEDYPKVCFIGQPEAGGMALNLTAACMEIFYSNSFKGDARLQAEDRAHRAGMDKNKGLIIRDYILLGSDVIVLNNIKKKKKLQNMTMDELNDAWANTDIER